MIRRAAWKRVNDAIEETGHALLLAMVGAALVAGWVVDVARSRTNVAIGAGFLVAAALLMLDAFGRLPGRWSHAGWVVLLVAASAFVKVNFF